MAPLVNPAASPPVEGATAAFARAEPRVAWVARVVKEPFVHFLLAGGVLFAGYSWLNPGAQSEPMPDPIRIGAGEVRWVRETFSGQWRRDPTPDEMQALLMTLLDEELLAREARTLGLDQHDTVVRRRLAQKLSFLVEDTARLAAPGEDHLRQFYANHAEDYRTAPRMTFRHVFFSPERRPDAAADAAAARALLASAGNAAPPALGDPLALEEAFADINSEALSSLFGADFARRVVALPVGSWSGPVRSAYGTHLVLVSSRSEGEMRPFEEVRGAVSEAWYRARQSALREEYLGRLRAKYAVARDAAARPARAGASDWQSGP